ncbi:MAG: NUDIX domain-containing protein [Ardenticatenaceae bacterium]|nr:NUDIX domain-containing protein [Ardenticatenaceae bacterium]
MRLVLIQNGSVLLVWHTYQPGWFFPGGGLKRGETFDAAARREAREEVGAEMAGLHFWGLYSNLKSYKSDHVVYFLCEDFHLDGQKDFEIEEYRFFPLTDLPPQMSQGTRKILNEYLQGDHQPTVGTL